VNIHNIQAALRAWDVFAALETEPIIESARHVSLDQLKGRAVLVLGHPRGAASLVELLSPLNFYVNRSYSGESLDGFSNRAPRANELPHYQRSGGESIHGLNLSGSDYGLVTLVRRKDGTHTLSLSVTTVTRLITWLSVSQNRILYTGWTNGSFGPSIPDFQYAQIVFKVQFLNSEPIEAEYVTHRLVRQDTKNCPPNVLLHVTFTPFYCTIQVV